MNANDILTGRGPEGSMNTGEQGYKVRKPGQILKLLARLFGALLLLAIALFCAFGFLASFEPGNGLIWKIVYGALGCGLLGGAVALLLSGRKNGSEGDGGSKPGIGG